MPSGAAAATASCSCRTTRRWATRPSCSRCCTLASRHARSRTSTRIARPIVRTLARWLGARPLPNLERRGVEARDGTRQALEATIEGVKRGENLLLYPAGHIKRRRLEEVGAASGVKAVLDNVSDIRVVLVRTGGVWGSSFSWGFTGRYPQLAPMLGRALGTSC